MAINIRSYNQILGDMVRKVVADTPLNDINAGSALLTILEAAAQVDFENSASILNVLELLNIDATRDNDLDTRGADFGLTRASAQKATGFVTLGDSSITTRSTGLYQVKPAPIAGATQIFVNDASEWAATGNLYIGRGTANFEGPIAYTTITDNGSFFTIDLASALQKDHLISDNVVDGQGTTDRLISAGTVVQIPANNQSPTIEFRTLRDAVIPAGEDSTTGVDIIASLAGTQSNAGINTITQYSSPPFTGATVANTTALTSGTDVETDSEFRERIKSFSNTLARGTESAITDSLIGISDSDDGKQVASAVITEPPRIGDPSILYIDDGSGFQPSFTGQSVDVLLNEATGNEEFLQLANFPLPRPQTINTIDGPFEITDSMQFRVLVDGVEETVTFTSSLFSNISAATVAEIIIAINDQSETFKATFTSDSSRILLYPTNFEAETIQVEAIRTTDDSSLFANNVLKFPTNEFSYIRLYQNTTLLNERVQAATLLTNTFSTWSIIAPGNLIISVDGTPPQDVSFSTSDFNGASFASLSIDEWVTAFNAKYAGITATATASGRMQIVSNKEGSTSALNILGGTYFDQMFANQDTVAAGRNSDFQLNRQTGNLRILTDIAATDSITAGTEDAKGNLLSATTPTGSYNVATDSSSRPAHLYIVPDSEEVTIRVGVGLAIGNVITVTDEGSSVMRLMSDSAASFDAIIPNDYLFIADRGVGAWINSANTGLFKVVAKGEHTSANVDTYVEVKNVSITPGVHTVEASEDIQAFRAFAYPQLWQGTFVTTPASVAIQELSDSFNDNLVNIESSIFKTNRLKITSSTEDDGTIAAAAGSGNALTLFSLINQQEGNDSHIANRSADKDFVSFFKRTAPTDTDADGVSGKNVWLDRVTYGDIRGAYTADAEPGVEGVDTYSEDLESTGALIPALVEYDDVMNFTGGSNKSHYRTIRDKLAGDRVGTQHELPRTLMDFTIGETFNLMRSMSINPEDSIVFILDQDAVSKTIDVRMSRTGQINSTFPPTNISFSADDSDNEPGITFGTLQVWGKATNNTEFQDYGMWFRARNWYTSGGSGSGGGSFMVRAAEYGPHGESIRFQIEYPTVASTASVISHDSNPDFTLATLFLGSDTERAIGEASSDTFKVTSLGSDVYRYTFDSPLTLAAVLADDVLSILPDAGVSAANSGQLSIVAVNDGADTLDVYNPGGAITTVGAQEVTQVDTIADVVGTPEIYSLDVNGLAGAALDGLYFVIEDTAGTVAVWFDTDDSGTAEPAHGAARSIEVNPAAAATSNTVASLIAGALGADSEFIASALLDIVTITNVSNGDLGALNVGTSGFLNNGGTNGSADISIDGLYFTLQDQNGSVAFWYDVSGITSEPLHGADRSVEITTVNAGDSANIVATKTAVFIAGDAEYASATVGTNDITITDVINGARVAASAGTSGFTVAEITPGVDDGVETIVLPTSFSIYPLVETSVAEIVAKISESPLLVAAEIDGTNPIVKATRDEVYTPAGIGDYSVSLSYTHDPAVGSGEKSFVRLFDSISWVKDFENTNPQFTLKQALLLNGVSADYALDTTPNEDATTGEYFKLVPVTMNNLYHHFTQKALSQLPIVAEVDISNAIRRIQIKSKLLGSQGAVEVVGGNANDIDFSIFGEGQVATGPETGDSFIEVKTQAFPVTLTRGDLVKVKNSQVSKRLNRLTTTDSIDVVKGTGDDTDYRWNPKDTRLSSLVRFTITDASATYARPAETVWRWTHNDGGSFFNITDDNNGVQSVVPSDQIFDDSLTSVPLSIDHVSAGTVSTPQNFRLTVGGVPAQADYYYFANAAGTETFAVWFDVDAAGTAPTGALYVGADHQIEVDILSSDSEDQIVSKLSAVLIADIDFLGEFSGVQQEGANLDDVQAGDLLSAYDTFPATWNSGNKAKISGDGNIAGLPIIAVNSASRFMDVVNPDGVALADEAIGTGSVIVTPTPIIKWNLKHAAKTAVVQAVNAAGTVTLTTSSQHGLREGDTFILDDNGLAQTTTVATVPSALTITFADTTAAANGAFPSGNIFNAAKTETRYRISSLGFNDLYRLEHSGGDGPGFVDCGVAVDDFMVIGGSTFSSNNSGTFRVLGVSNDNIVYQNSIATEELHTLVPFNNRSIAATWVSNFNEVTGVAGTFKNLSIGDWVKKPEDDDTLFRQVTGLLDLGGSPTTALAAVRVTLGSNYEGTSATAEGVSFDQNSNVNQGNILQGTEDIQFFEGDSVRVGDNLFVDSIANDNWFSTVNSGTFDILQIGTDGTTYKPFVQVANASGLSESDRLISVSELGYFILEGANNIYESVRQVEHSVIDNFNNDRRSIYMTPATKVDKMSISSGTQITPIGKLGYSTDVTTGVDGYTYYTGLLRTVQRVVDGFEPDPITYPGRRAVGGIIETLPPLIKRVTMSIEVTTNEGVNLNEISNDIKTAIINYVDGLGVSDDVIMSEVIVAVMDITGVAAITFNTPEPSTERISVADNEKAFIEPDDISVA